MKDSQIGLFLSGANLLLLYYVGLPKIITLPLTYILTFFLTSLFFDVAVNLYYNIFSSKYYD